MPSTRNFQLTLHGDAAATVVMFGKTDEGLYSLDYTYPLSAFQAFCLALCGDPELSYYVAEE